MPCSGPAALTAMTRSKSAGATSPIRARWVTPAALTRPSTRSSGATSRAQLSGSATSSRLSAGSVMSAPITVSPASRRSCAVAAPMPLAAPVTMMTPTGLHPPLLKIRKTVLISHHGDAATTRPADPPSAAAPEPGVARARTAGRRRPAPRGRLRGLHAARGQQPLGRVRRLDLRARGEQGGADPRHLRPRDGADAGGEPPDRAGVAPRGSPRPRARRGAGARAGRRRARQRRHAARLHAPCRRGSELLGARVARACAGCRRRSRARWAPTATRSAIPIRIWRSTWPSASSTTRWRAASPTARTSSPTAASRRTCSCDELARAAADYLIGPEPA